MKTLKKTLSLTLVFAMVFSLMSMAFAADTTATTTKTTGYTDAASITYKQAVDVTTAIGVFQGNDSKAFAPKDNLTREQAAKIICYVSMGKTAADALTATSAPFTDVPASRWSAGSIAYCAKQGIVAGYGDGKFGPTDTVTGYQFAKMLLVALGYDATIEQFNGSDWSINVAKRAFANKLFAGNSAFVGTNNVTREESALYTFNMINKINVSYSSRGTEIKLPDGTTIRQGASAPSQDVANLLYRQTHFTSLSKSTVETTDALGRPSSVWYNGTTKIGVYADDSYVVNWTADHSGASDTTVEKALAGYTYAAASAGTIVTDGTTNASATLSAAAIKALTGNGVLVEVYANDNDVINRVVVVNTVLAQIINKDTANKTVTVQDAAGKQVTLKATSDTTAFGTAYTTLYALNLKDYVLLNEHVSGANIDAIYKVSAPTVIAGQITSKVTGANAPADTVYTVGGKTYQAAKEYATLMNSLNFTTVYTMLTDSYGYVKTAAVSTSATTYAFMLQGSKDGSAQAGYTYNAQLLFADGSVKWVKMASYNGSTDESALLSATSVSSKYVTYVANSDGSYSVATTGVTTTNVNTSAAAKTITNGSTAFDSKTVSNSTVFLIYDSTKKTFSAYAGIKNVPTTVVPQSTPVVAWGLDSGTAYKVVVVKSSTTTTADAVYVYNTTATASNYVNGVQVDTFNAIVNGVMTTVNAVNGQITAQGMLVGNNYSNGVIATKGADVIGGNVIADAKATSFTKAANASAMYKTTLAGKDIKLTDGILTITTTGGISGVVGDNFTCYVVDTSDSTCTIKSLSSTAFTFTGDVYLAIDANGYVAYAIAVQA